MQIETVHGAEASVVLDRDEVRLLNNAINEVCSGVQELGDDREFATRLGSSREEARALLAQISRLLDQM